MESGWASTSTSSISRLPINNDQIWQIFEKIKKGNDWQIQFLSFKSSFVQNLFQPSSWGNSYSFIFQNDYKFTLFYSLSDYLFFTFMNSDIIQRSCDNWSFEFFTWYSWWPYRSSLSFCAQICKIRDGTRKLIKRYFSTIQVLNFWIICLETGWYHAKNCVPIFLSVDMRVWSYWPTPQFKSIISFNWVMNQQAQQVD